MFFGVAGAALLAAGTYFPQLKTSLGYTYTIAGTPSYICYGIAVLLLVFALLADKIRIDLAARLSIIPICLIAGCLVYGNSVYEQGTGWAAREAAFDSPGWKMTAQDKYWHQLGEMTGETRLRTLYENWGPYVTWNNNPVFQNTIGALSREQADSLLQAGEVPQTYTRFGLALFIAALLSQLLATVAIWIRSRAGS